MPIWCTHTKRAANGPQGFEGNIPAANDNGVLGKNGELLVITDNNKGLSTGYSLSFTQMLLHEAELDYLNQRFETSAEKLIWIKSIVLSTTAFKSEAVDMLVAGQELEMLPDVQLVLVKRINVLLTKLSQGLDYYGHFPGHVPLTTLDVYEQTINRMLPLAGDIEKAYEQYYTKQQEDVILKKAIDTAVSTLEIQYDRIDNQILHFSRQIQGDRDEVASLLLEEEALKFKVEKAEEEFKEAVARQASCGFEDALKAGAAVTAIATGIGAIAAGGTAIFNAGQMIEKSKTLEQWKKTGQYIVKQAKVIKGGIDELKKGYNDIKEVVELERDAGKLIVAEDDFDKMIDKFSNLPEANQYQKLMKQYLAIIKLRNNKILGIDAAISQVYELESEQEGIEHDIASTKIRNIQVFNRRLAEHYVFFDKALRRVKADLLKAVVMAHRALNYWSLNGHGVPRDLQDRSVDQIKAYYAGFIADILNERTNRNSAPTKFTTGKIQFSRGTHPELFDTFDVTGQFTVEIEKTNREFVLYSQMLVTSLKLAVKSRKPFEGTRWVKLVHNGDPLFIDRQNKEHRFLHDARSFPIQFSKSQDEREIELGSSKVYAELSPLASWSLSMEFANDTGLLDGEYERKERKNIKQVDFMFSGVTFAR
ncbi:hypothetical protein [Rheinheimera sp.]|uniref:hypothetical protein n=1 Tax=Rheinheimera sp. TaxID=1869214 RepID=UPI0027363EE3|nr:hypothetical protein [Rheinheimera sp.]MDP2716434.1 hypothetical protein [Rheinheimera sp.]